MKRAEGELNKNPCMKTMCFSLQTKLSGKPNKCKDKHSMSGQYIAPTLNAKLYPS